MPKITVEFSSEEEFEAFKTSGKKTRAKKGDNGADASEETSATSIAPAPILPQQAATFAPNPGSTQGAGSFTPPGDATFQAPAIDPGVQALVTRIVGAIDKAIASGQPADAILGWFRQQCGAAGVSDAAAATMDQMKNVVLARTPVPALEQMAKLMNA